MVGGSSGSSIRDSYNYELNKDDFALFKDTGHCERYLANKSTFNYKITENGTFYIEEDLIWKEYNVNDLKYCLETGYDSESGEKFDIVTVCSRYDVNDLRFQLSRSALILSCICLLITLLVYIFIYKLRKTIHKIIVCYCICELVAFTLLVIMQFQPLLGDYCKPVGFVFNYAFMGGFSWLNVMCYDIWQAIRRVKTRVWKMKSIVVRKVIFYSCYALITPTILTLIYYLVHIEVFAVPDVIFPYLGVTGCILENSLYENNYAHTLFFVLPTGILIFINVVFFAKTVWYFMKVKRDLNKIADSSNHQRTKEMKIDRKKFTMILKLTLLMGINWIFEVVSSVIDFKQNHILKTIELIFDIFNCLQGVFLFFIFAFKWKTIKYSICKIAKHVNKESPATSSSTKSMSNLSVEVSTQTAKIEMDNLNVAL